MNYVVIIDDNNTGHLHLRKAITKEIPHTIIESLYNVSEALQYFQNANKIPDLIFLNFGVKNIFNLDMLRYIKNNKSHENTPVVVIAEEKSECNIHHIYQTGANEFYNNSLENIDMNAMLNQLRNKWLLKNS